MREPWKEVGASVPRLLSCGHIAAGSAPQVTKIREGQSTPLFWCEECRRFLPGRGVVADQAVRRPLTSRPAGPLREAETLVEEERILTEADPALAEADAQLLPELEEEERAVDAELLLEGDEEPRG